MSDSVKQMESEFIVLSPVLKATPVRFTPETYALLDEQFDGFRGHVLASSHTFSKDWPTWDYTQTAMRL